MDHVLECTACGRRMSDYSLPRCNRCNSILEVKYDYSKIKLPKNFTSMKIRHEKYLPFLPIESFKVKLSDGATPMVRKRPSGTKETLFFKLETKNPTKSFKDRGSAVEVSRALEMGFGKVTCGSTGNMGISVAKYSSMVGIKATIFISKDADKKKIDLIKSNGAHEVKIKGDFNAAVAEAEYISSRMNALACGDYHYRKEGQKSMIFEIIEQMKYDVPDFVFVPIGNATLLAGIYKGLIEFRRFGLISKFPRIVAVQSEMCAPFVNAYNTGKPIKYVIPKTVADAIAVGYPTFGFEGIIALKKTMGIAVVVSDKEIIDAVKKLRRTGIGCEPGGAAAFAGYAKLYSKNAALLKGKKSVVIVSGNN